MFRDFFIGNDVGYHCPAAFLQDSKDFLEQLSFRFRLDEIQNAIGDDHVDRIRRDERVLEPQFMRELISAQKGGRIGDRPRL